MKSGKFVRLLAVAATMAITMGAVAPAAEAQGKSGRQVVAEAVGAEIRPVGKVAEIQGVTIEAPDNRETYVTDAAMITVLERGQTTAEFMLPGQGDLLHRQGEASRADCGHRRGGLPCGCRPHHHQLWAVHAVLEVHP